MGVEDILAIIVGDPWWRALITILITVVVAKLFQNFLIVWIKHLTRRTTTDIDDHIINMASTPVFFLIVLGGLYYTFVSLGEIMAEYMVWVDRVFFILAIIMVAWVGSRIFALLVTRWFKKHRGLTGSPRLLNIVIASVIYVVAFIIVLSHFEIEVSPFIAALGVGGLAVGLALQDTLSNVFAGLHIIGDQPIRVHDIIEIQGQNLVGEVEDIGWRSTRIRTYSNNLVIVPNNTIATSILTNYEMPQKGMRTVIECGVDYGSDLKKVEKITLDVANKVQKKFGVPLKEFEPLFRLHTFADSNINFRVILMAKDRGGSFLLQNEFIKALHDRYNKENIEISWPVQKNYNMNKK